mgnify:FL=1|jgi:hypothetical protein
MANNININPNILNENVDKVVLRPAQLMGKRLREVSENMKCLQYLYQMRMDKIRRANEDWAETVSCKNRYY